MKTGICKTCGKETELVPNRRVCRTCFLEERKVNNKKYRENNPESDKAAKQKWENNNTEKISVRKKKYYQENKPRLSAVKKEYKQTHKKERRISDKKYRENNKDTLNAKERDKHANDPNFRIRKIVSVSIRMALKNNLGSKQGLSCMKYIGYSIEEMRVYLESLFDLWMTWENHGPYNAETWNDNDQSTWTWQIDHIIPQSLLPYTSMEDDNFKKCWALSNLRPYSAKQ